MKTLLLCGFALFVANATCWADEVLSDSLTVLDGNQNIVGQVIVNEDGTFSGLNSACTGATCGTAEDPTNIYYINDTTLANAAQFGNAFYLDEGDGTNSDIFGIANISNQLYLSFASDSETQGVNFGSGFNTVPEGDGVFNVTNYLAAGLQTAGYTATFTSDSAPEPGTFGLLALSVAGGLALIRFRRAKA
jgi:MYXO-CTERM domain-containing protein